MKLRIDIFERPRWKKCGTEICGVEHVTRRDESNTEVVSASGSHIPGLCRLLLDTYPPNIAGELFRGSTSAFKPLAPKKCGYVRTIESDAGSIRFAGFANNLQHLGNERAAAGASLRQHQPLHASVICGGAS